MTSLAFADSMEIGKMISRPKNHGIKERRKVALSNLSVRINQGPKWWIDRGYTAQDADVKYRLAQSEASVLETRIKK